MDPVTAVALAGNILQFIQFVAGLLDNAHKLHASATGTSFVNDHFQDICGTLITFNTQLQKPTISSTGQSIKLSKHAEPLAECATACARDCEDLLRIMNKLRAIATKSPRYWNSFRAALAEVWKQNEIEDLRSRIADRHRQMTLLLCAASNESIQTLDTRVKDIGRGIWKLQTDSRLDSIIQEIRSLKDRVGEHDQSKLASTDYVSSICAGFSKLSLETESFEKEAQILATLNYSDRTARHEKIPDAHFTTFKWSLRKTEETEEKYGRLQRWLRTDDALFWVSGKPGSGKSTFMKSIADSRETKRCLETWAGNHELLIIGHYFTIYGTPIQRSLEGLLRSLVFGILALKPMLIQKLLVDRWERSGEQSRWTQSELEALLRAFGTKTEGLPSKICYFIDGLDEFEGDHLDICQTLKQLSQSPFIKVCVSSRPWNVFEDALGDQARSKLYMHELTRGDIRNYTEFRLKEHPRWSILQEEAGYTSSRTLVDEVVVKSNGVFLWVTLVVRLLREGLTNDDSVFDLQKRLSSLPSDLEEFFRHIIRTVDPFYNHRMAATLSLALEAREPLCLEIYSFHDRENDDNENYALKDPTDLMTTDLTALNKLFSTVSRRINGRCKGLLERNGDRMEFLHRTVYDFLRTDEMSQFLGGQLRKSHNPNLSILKAFIAWIKRSTFSYRTATNETTPTRKYTPRNEINGFITRLRQALQYARLAETQTDNSRVLTATLLDNMEHSISLMLTRGQIEMTDPSFARDIFRQLVLGAGISSYIRNKLTANPGFFSSHYTDPLYLVLDPMCKLTTEDQYWVLNQLLKSGHNPRHSARDARATENLRVAVSWEYVLQQCSSDDKLQWIDALLAYTESRILLTFLNYGADPSITINITFEPEDCDRQRVMPIWLALLIAIVRVHLCKVSEPYEETMVAILDHPETLRGAMNYENWDRCQRYFPLPSETRLNNEDFLVRIFALVLSNIPPYLQTFVMAKDWMSPVLSADGNNKLEAAVAAARAKKTKKRHVGENKQETSGKRRKRTPRAMSSNE
ncbi:hypothetical protein F4678DRAFT_440604 [Xylaria arbuscula]|nr:hypothetical protein F4678DRAFT_440604 [Xylaria arbuscula]